ncbi:MAG TPA: hypothetical protein VJU85_08830 [Nitrososphaeraceae archaeon]|nr:hypothetical protein [Nitrososphaeraceae archaeon]
MFNDDSSSSSLLLLLFIKGLLGAGEPSSGFILNMTPVSSGSGPFTKKPSNGPVLHSYLFTLVGYLLYVSLSY